MSTATTTTSTLSSVPPTSSDPALVKFKDEIKAIAGPRLPADPNDPAGQRPNMAHIHLLFINALESVWEGAERCKGDERNFIAYALVVAKEIEQHHHAEETIYFPFLIAKGVEGLEHNVEEHHVMHARLDTVLDYLRSLQSDDSALAKFDPNELRELLVPLLDELVPHLRHELDTLALDKLEGKLGLKEMVEMNKLIDDMLKGYDANIVLPFFVINAHPGSNFPPLPFFVRKFLIPVVLKKKHAPLWKYGRYPREIDLW